MKKIMKKAKRLAAEIFIAPIMSINVMNFFPNISHVSTQFHYKKKSFQ